MFFRLLWNMLALAIAASIVGCSSTPVVSSNESIVVSKLNDAFNITVPVSKLVLLVPAGDFESQPPAVKAGSTASARYFLLSDKQSGQTLSGWFESARTFPGVKEPPVASFEGVPLIHQHVSFETIGPWSIVLYDVPFRSTVIANVHAHLVRAGTWVELHISADQRQPILEQRAELAKILRSIDVQDKQ